jgi:NodT family efflux transporter outer membrane factor (OMF) lipoprotein
MTMREHLGLAAGTLILALLLAACASTNGLTTEASLRDANALEVKKSLAAVPRSPSAWPRDEWWTVFNDPQLDALIDEALADNPSLRVAEARTRKALAIAATSKAALSPQVNAESEISRQRAPAHGLTPPPLGGQWGTLFQLQASFDWQLDFWGKNRSAYESALGQARAAEVDSAAARLALSVNIAQAYVQLHRAYLQLAVAQATLKEREQIYALTRDRNSAGIDSRLELKQAETALPATREQIAQLDETIGLTRNALAALLGAGPDRGLAIAVPVPNALHTVALPSDIPAELVGRRPDIVAQRWRIEAAQKDVASAKAAFYPDVNLVALIGLQSIGPAGFLSAASRMVGIGPAVSLPIFDGGRLRGNLAGSDADYDIVVEQYNELLDNALRDIVDQLTSLASVETQHREQEQALADAQEAYDLALLRYREGIGNYLQVLSAESPLLAQQSLEADLRARDLQLSIDLVRALGGGFTASEGAVAAAR